jgi:hypothetical protein
MHSQKIPNSKTPYGTPLSAAGQVLLRMLDLFHWVVLDGAFSWAPPGTDTKITVLIMIKNINLRSFQVPLPSLETHERKQNPPQMNLY